MRNNKPIHTIKMGRIRIAIWANPAPFEGAFYYNLVPTRTLRNGDKWTSTNGFGDCDVQVLLKALTLANDWILAHKASQEEVVTLPPPPPRDDFESDIDLSAAESPRLPEIKP
jgi:hypothetical protein